MERVSLSDSPCTQQLTCRVAQFASPGGHIFDKLDKYDVTQLNDSRIASQREGAENMAKVSTNVLFIAGFGPIDRDIAQSRALYGEGLGISFKEDAGGYLYTGALHGAKHFALWPLSEAAQSCFGTDSWPDNIPAPQAWLEFEVENVETATDDLESRGYRMLTRNQKEPWGQIVSRFLSPEGLLVAVVLTPSLRKQK
jgi:hypothetical protein